MAMGQDRLTFYGVLAAIAIAVVGYFQLGKLYPAAGPSEVSAQRVTVDAEPLEDGAEPGVARNQEDVE